MNMVLSETGNLGGRAGLGECVKKSLAFSKYRSPAECWKCVPVAWEIFWARIIDPD